MQFNIEDYKQFCTVEAATLSNYPGWVVLGEISETYWQQVYTNGSSNSIETTRAKILIGLKDESPAHDLNLKFNEKCAEIDDKNINIKELIKKTDRLNDTIKALNDSLEDRMDRVKSLEANQMPLKDKLLKMEADLGKVRKAIGDLKFNEIVNA